MRFNLALAKSTKQSSTNSIYASSQAVDGHSHIDPTRCTRTNLADGLHNWWQVDLGEVYVIQQVVIINRNDTGMFQIRTLKSIFTNQPPTSKEHKIIIYAMLSVLFTQPRGNSKDTF
ncbi:hypothetical protein NP493_17g02053 [Ridgeia piscesae]|uniref:F5/8 type C domain-containing protein n=1 Tax=Ridgeia piscesae TaxID=27915 RepID=A0AAD9PEH4_RIDPI|nr:hypothetical protein NP493_17g02053 [Ridgeia piscesae]